MMKHCVLKKSAWSGLVLLMVCALVACSPSINTDYPEPIPETARLVIGKYEIKEIKARYGTDRYPQPLIAPYVYIVYESESRVGMVARINNLYTGDRLAYFMRTIELAQTGEKEVAIFQNGRVAGNVQNGKLEFAGMDEEGYSIKISAEK
ncbi:MAG: hypothetical protein U0Y10_17515 [Spirosomataceae bacterium]